MASARSTRNSCWTLGWAWQDGHKEAQDERFARRERTNLRALDPDDAYVDDEADASAELELDALGVRSALVRGVRVIALDQRSDRSQLDGLHPLLSLGLSSAAAVRCSPREVQSPPCARPWPRELGAGSCSGERVHSSGVRTSGADRAGCPVGAGGDRHSRESLVARGHCGKPGGSHPRGWGSGAGSGAGQRARVPDPGGVASALSQPQSALATASGQANDDARALFAKDGAEARLSR